MQSSYGYNWRAPKVNVHDFAMSPRAEIPRSTIRMQHTHKTTISASYLYPVYLKEVLPGDSFNTTMTMFARLATPIYPLLDNAELESFFFFVPMRLVWIHWYKFQGEQDLPTDSIAYTIPTITSPAGGFPQLSLYDYYGLPCSGQTLGGNTLTISALPLRAYNLIWNEWFRDQNINSSAQVGSLSLTQVGSTAGYGHVSMDDGPDASTQYVLQYSSKRRDYFTSALPWPQKGSQGAIPIISGNASGQGIITTAASNLNQGAQNPASYSIASTGLQASGDTIGIGSGGALYTSSTAAVATTAIYQNNLYLNMTTLMGNTINALRTAVQTQKLLERDARGGTRYPEIIQNHWGIRPQDARLARPEYLGGGRSPINITPVPQTSGTGASGTTAPIGTLSAAGTLQARHGFNQSFAEHGYVIGLVAVRRENQYQQGIDKLWARRTRYDFYMPVFAELGEQAVLNQEIYSDGSANDALTFGYVERWGEYRWARSYCTAYFNSKNTTPLDTWHLAIKFTGLPSLSAPWVADDTITVLERVLAAGGSSAGQQVLCDFFFDEKIARLMPVYSVPGHLDHF